MYKYAGVTLDFYDDKGRTLKEKFPNQEDLPEIIKTAEVYPSEGVPDDAFALVAVDGDHVLKKYACTDPGTTAMSVIYFMEHGDKLPEDAQKVAAVNLVDACVEHGMLPPAELTKQAKWYKPWKWGEALKKGTRELARESGGAAGEAASKATRKELEPLLKNLKDEIAPTVSKATKDAVQTAKNEMAAGAKKAVKGVTGSMAAGAAGGAATADPKDRLRGAVRGAGAGLLGGAAGGAWGGGMGTALGGAAAAGAASGMLGRKLREKGVKSLTDEVQKGMSGTAAPSIKVANVVDITGRLPKAKHASAPFSNEDYAVTSKGRQLYPIDTWDNVKLASDYWEQHRRIMDPEMRHEFAVKVAAKAAHLGIQVSDELEESGSTKYASAGHLKVALEMRKCAFDATSADVEFLDELFEKHASMRPEVYSEVLHRFDDMHDLTAGWDQVFMDPWSSTYGIDKTASVVWESGVDRVTSDDLSNLARNHSGSLGEIFASEDMLKGFEKDPEGVFNGLPDPHKKIMARLAADMSSQGGSETTKDAV